MDIERFYPLKRFFKGTFPALKKIHQLPSMSPLLLALNSMALCHYLLSGSGPGIKNQINF